MHRVNGRPGGGLPGGGGCIADGRTHRHGLFGDFRFLEQNHCGSGVARQTTGLLACAFAPVPDGRARRRRAVAVRRRLPGPVSQSPGVAGYSGRSRRMHLRRRLRSDAARRRSFAGAGAVFRIWFGSGFLCPGHRPSRCRKTDSGAGARRPGGDIPFQRFADVHQVSGGSIQPTAQHRLLGDGQSQPRGLERSNVDGTGGAGGGADVFSCCATASMCSPWGICRPGPWGCTPAVSGC